MRRKLFGNIAEGPQPKGAAIQQPHLETKPLGPLEALAKLLGDMPQRLAAGLQRQALTRVAVGAGRFGGEAGGEGFARGAQAVSAPFAGVLLHVTEVVVLAQALKDHVPEGDQGGEGPLVKGALREGQPGGQPGGGQEFMKEAEELAGRETGAEQGRGRVFRRLGRAAVGFAGFFGVTASMHML